LDLVAIAAHTAAIVEGQRSKAAENKKKSDAKQNKTAAQGKKRASVKWLPKWFTDFPWLVKSPCGNKAKCTICERFSPYLDGRKGLMGPLEQLPSITPHSPGTSEDRRNTWHRYWPKAMP
jgi:hypothetical protein